MAEKQSTPKTFEKCLKHNPTKTLRLSDIFLQKNLQKWPIKVNFRGWRKPRQNWVNWVEKLSLKYAKIWELTGICDGILSSLHKIKPNPEIILALSEFWCSKTNTFIFPWGEATITLEDVNVLYGLPVFGETVNFSLFDSSSKNMQDKLQQVKDDLSTRTNESKAWITYFNEEKDEIEHVGFLAYWLSMFVFPDLNDRRVGKHVFLVAVHLARGVKIALAPAVLACLYQNLTFITQHAADIGSAMEVSVPGAFQIVQLWALERFPFLGSKLVEPLSLGQPRIARWDKLRLKVSLVDLRNVLRSSGDSFSWRPYSSDLENWQNRSSVVFLQPQELIGIACTEIYRPQRVKMQFGCDRKVIGETAVCSPLDSGNGSLLKVEKPSRAHKNATNKGLEREANGDDHKNWMIASNVMEMDLNHVEDTNLPESAANVSPKSEIWKCGPGNKVKSSNSSPRFMLETCENEGNKDHNDSIDLDHLPLALQLCSKAVIGENLIKRQESGKCRSGMKVKSPCAAPQLMLKTSANEDAKDDNDSSDSDNLPLALRLCSNARGARLVGRQESGKRRSGMKVKSPCAPPRLMLKPCENKDAKDDNDSCDSDNLPLALRLCSKARIGERLVGRQESGKRRPGVKVKSTCDPPRLMLKPCENKDAKDGNDSSDSDNLPLALRLHSNAVIKKVALRNKKVRAHTSAALKSPLIKTKRSSDPNGRKGVSAAKKRVASDSLDIDHVPLALRLQLIARSGGTLGRKRVASDPLDIDHVPLALRLQSIARSGGTLTRKRVASDSLDIDHVPLAFRLQSITQSVGTFKATVQLEMKAAHKIKGW